MTKPWPSLLTILLAMNPAISPKTIQPMMDIGSSLEHVFVEPRRVDSVATRSDIFRH